MSSIKLSPNPSGAGIFTIEAPNSAVNYTFTLPTQTGTVLTNAGPFTANASASAGAVTIDASNNVGIGTSSPGARLHSTKAGAEVARFTNSQSNGGDWEFKIGGGGFEDRKLMITDKYSGADNVRVSIDSSGNLLVGTTSFSLGRVNIGGYTNGDRFGLVMRPSANNATPILFQNAAGTDIGSIATTSTATSYNTSSDYRLKNSIAPMTGALAKVQALKPVTYKWNADGSEGEGFIAHELAEICPQAVTGEKDAVDADGNPQYQGIDVSFLVATLTAALQELNAKVAALEARLASDGPSNGGQA